MIEFYNILLQIEQNNPFLILYTNGNPDHKITYLHVQLSLIAIFKALDLDYLVIIKTLLGHLWKNPVEKIILIFNLNMQSIGLIYVKMSEECKNIISICNNIEDIHEKAKESSQLKNELLESLQPTIELLSSIFER